MASVHVFHLTVYLHAMRFIATGAENSAADGLKIPEKSAFIEAQFQVLGKATKAVTESQHSMSKVPTRLCPRTNRGVQSGTVTACCDDADAFCHAGPNLRFKIYDLTREIFQRKTNHNPPNRRCLWVYSSQGGEKLRFPEIRPERLGDHQFGVRNLPQQKIAEAHFAAVRINKSGSARGESRDAEKSPASLIRPDSSFPPLF